MKRLVIVAVAVLGVWACAQGESASDMAADTLTRREKDSLLSTAPIPGASKIGDAQRAADRLNARTEAHDTIG